MEFHLLNGKTFVPHTLLDHYESAIWTERYIEPGDVTLVVQATAANVKLLAPGELLALKGVKDPMLLHTRSIDDGMLTATGKTLETFFNDRYMAKSRMEGIPSSLMAQIAFKAFHGYFNKPPFQDPPLVLGDADAGLIWNDETSGDASIARHIPDSTETGAYDSILALANRYNVGMRVWLKTADADPVTTNPKVVFSTRRGADLTGGNSDEPYVRFSPDLQSLENLKELYSLVDYKNLVYGLKPKWATMSADPVPYWSRFSPEPNPGNLPFFAVKDMAFKMDDLQEEDFSTVWEEQQEELWSIMERRAEKLLNEHRKNQVIDGEVPPEGLLKFDEDYRLGDLVQVQGHDATILRARITEFIRSSDNTGERMYPTFMPDPDKISPHQYLPNTGN